MISILADKIPCSSADIPCSAKIITGSVEQGICGIMAQTPQDI
jgi:hypothetical protein